MPPYIDSHRRDSGHAVVRRADPNTDRNCHSDLSTSFHGDKSFFRAFRMRGAGLSSPRHFEAVEVWHEKVTVGSYRCIAQAVRAGWDHPVTPQEVVDRVESLPKNINMMVRDRLEVVQLSGMTEKQKIENLYGLQWGAGIYLYPMMFGDESESYFRQEYPRPLSAEDLQQASRFGAKVECLTGGKKPEWAVHWSLESARDFYLNSILLHEIGHLLDTRNVNFSAREAYANHFATQHGGPSTLVTRPVRHRHNVKVSYFE